MSRDESDREDLLREATALVERVELAPANSSGVAAPANSIVIGFRANGALSVFFGADPVYQFNSGGELRRAYISGLLYKAERGRLVSLERVRTPSEVQLLRRELPADEEATFIEELRTRLNRLFADLESGARPIVGQVPATANILPRIQRWLSEHTIPTIAASPRV